MVLTLVIVRCYISSCADVSVVSVSSNVLKYSELTFYFANSNILSFCAVDTDTFVSLINSSIAFSRPLILFRSISFKISLNFSSLEQDEPSFIVTAVK